MTTVKEKVKAATAGGVYKAEKVVAEATEAGAKSYDQAVAVTPRYIEAPAEAGRRAGRDLDDLFTGSAGRTSRRWFSREPC